MTTPQIIVAILLCFIFARDFVRGGLLAIQQKIDNKAKGIKEAETFSALVILILVTFINTSIVIGCLTWALIIGGFFKQGIA